MLNYQDLNKGFLNIFDNKGEYTENLQIICQKWTNVFEDFYLNQIMPISGKQNPNLYPSLQIFKSSLLTLIKNQTWNLLFEKSVQNLHLGVCQGVNMTGVYTTTPPTFPLILKDCWRTDISTKELSHKLALKIFNWVSYTFSTQVSSGITIRWI